DVLQACFAAGALPARAGGVTVNLPLIGAPRKADQQHHMHMPQGLHSYGSEAAVVNALPGAERWLADGLSEAMVRFAVRHEYAITVEDMLARRSRLLFLDARQAAAVAPQVAAVLQEELRLDDVGLPAFLALARQYMGHKD